jgi:hypothetical protein
METGGAADPPPGGSQRQASAHHPDDGGNNRLTGEVGGMHDTIISRPDVDLVNKSLRL